MNLAALKVQVRDLLADAKNYTPNSTTAITAQSYSDAQITDALNFACKEFAKRTGCTYAETACTANTTYNFTIPSTYLKIVDVLDNNKKELNSTSLFFENLHDPSWRSTWATTKTPKRWFKLDGDSIAVTPGFPSGLYPYVCLLQVPTALASDADNVDTRIDVSFQEYLKYAACAYLLQIEGDGQNIGLADKWMDMFNRLVGNGGA